MSLRWNKQCCQWKPELKSSKFPFCIWLRLGVLPAYLITARDERESEKGRRRRRSGPPPRFALENSFLLAGYHGNPHSQPLLKQTATEGANEGGGEGGEEEWRTPFLELMFSFLLPLVWLVSSESSDSALCVFIRLHGCGLLKPFKHAITMHCFSLI